MSGPYVAVGNEGTGLFLRWKDGEKRTSRVFTDKPPGHPTAMDPCPACGRLLVGEPTILVVIGPGDDPDRQERHAAGRWYSATCVEVHAACAGVRDPDAPSLARLADLPDE